MEPIITNQELLDLHETSSIIIIEAASGQKAEEIYKQEHLFDAQFVDLDRDLSSVSSPEYGGRHPLPSVAEFSNVLSKLGIQKDNHVVIYDRANATNAAARFWWMLRSIGHKKVQVLSGGFTQAKLFGLPTSSQEKSLTPVSPYTIDGWGLPTTEMPEVISMLKDDQKLIIDVREEGRYRGEFEPLDQKAGHIPSAVNIPLSNNLDEFGFFKSKEQLKALYEPYFDGKLIEDITVHCGSGVTACHTLLALDYAGLPIPKLYVGSWSEWSRNDNPFETGKRVR